ncbi:DUF4252 domain-containing protein [Phaeocystidibacter marisrubri]|uniref:DUF4252 domain-containing protein n=1 Tax=Phaeocystidibacter marisrubri TaxID=1577780 RepID=A0A6L3ZJD4_9FLAO|nr:DUF4252 domain-containing protein [Phaeocystidibacter marisrubri]KAB2817927.1 DUF4252 domain-containing protein [Phaeocystidibacter marisrubri]GGH72828.1 hypothetical protein GCM10011318_17210 [Phaeocystidibacter marisrubri]
MKTKLTAVFIIVLSWVGMAQTPSVDLHKYLDRQEGVFSMSLNTSIEDFFDGQLDIDERDFQIEGDASKIQLSIISDDADTESIYHHVTSSLRSANLERISIEEDGEKVTLWMVRNGDIVTEIHAIIIDKDDPKGLIIATLLGEFVVEE